MTNELPALMTSKEVSEALRLSMTRVQELASSGVLQPVRFTERGHLRFRKSEIEALLAQSADGGDAARPSTTVS